MEHINLGKFILHMFTFYVTINLIHFLLTHVTQKMSLADFGAALTLRPHPKGEGT